MFSYNTAKIADVSEIERKNDKISNAMTTKHFSFRRHYVNGIKEPPQMNLTFFETVPLLFRGDWLSCRTDGNIREQTTIEQQTIVLVGALFLTITIPATFLTDGWDDDWIKALFGILMNVSNTGLVVCILFSVILLLGINECSDEELPIFLEKIGGLSKLPFVSFLTGVVTFGGFAMSLWCYRTFELYVWIIITALGQSGSALILFPGLSKLVQSIFIVKNGKYGNLIMSMSELERAANAYIKIQKDDQCLEICSFADFKLFLLEESKCDGFAELTSCRVKKAYDHAMGDILHSEYIPPKTSKE